MSNPVTVTITNLTDLASAIRWTAQGPVWLPANGTVDIPYEPWSCADRAQRQAILACCGSKQIKLTLHVPDTDGKIIDFDYDPSTILQATPTPAPKEYEPLPKRADVEIKTDNDHSHIVMAGGDGTAQALGFKSEEVKAPETKVKDTDERVGGFVVQKSNASGVTTTDVLKGGTAAEAFETSKPEAAAEDPVKADFAKAVDEKRWDDALQLLVDKFGADKVTFTTRVIMAMKDYDAVVAKYKLA